MIGEVVTDKDGIPLDNHGKKLSPSQYQPPKPISTLFNRCQQDYGTAWQLQHRPFEEFDGVSLLDRARLDQQTFGAFVGAEYVPKSKAWRWRGRKQNARNKLIAIAAHVVGAALIPTVFATDDQNDESRECAAAMRIMLTEHLRRAGYDVKFLYALISALVNPACFMQVEFVEKMQTVKVRLAGGEIKVKQAIDELMSGLNLNIVPIDELMLGDFFTFNMQAQPFLVRIRRISYDVARGVYAGRYFDKAPEGLSDAMKGKVTEDGTIDRFDFVEAGRTRIFAATQENQTLYDVDWTEADGNMVQEATFYYRGEDLQLTWVGGVFMGNFDPENPDDVYNTNPFMHRRMTLVGEEWGSMPVYPYTKTGFEPLDPGMRFAYYKSGAFKEFWDDATLNMTHRLLVDGMHLDVLKPLLVSGAAKYDGNVIAPSAVASLPKDAVVQPYNLGPNLAAAMNVLVQQQKDIEDSTIANVMQGQLGTKQTATAVIEAVANAKKMMGVFGTLLVAFVNDVGELAIDCIIQNTTVGELHEQLPGALGLKFNTMLVRARDKNKEVTHKIVMTDKYMGKKMTPAQVREREWDLWEQGGGDAKDATKIWEINPRLFARRRYSCFVDAEEIMDRSTGADKLKKDKALAVLTSPLVAPFTDREAVVNDFAIEPYGGNDPERYKSKGDPNAMMSSMGMGGEQPGGVDTAALQVPGMQQ